MGKNPILEDSKFIINDEVGNKYEIKRTVRRDGKYVLKHKNAIRVVDPNINDDDLALVLFGMLFEVKEGDWELEDGSVIGVSESK